MTQKLAKVAATVQGITESHTILYGRLLVAFEAYAKRQLPPREDRITHISFLQPRLYSGNLT